MKIIRYSDADFAGDLLDVIRTWREYEMKHEKNGKRLWFQEEEGIHLRGEGRREKKIERFKGEGREKKKKAESSPSTQFFSLLVWEFGEGFALPMMP